MAIERVQRQGWFSRLRSSVGGLVVGLILVLLAGGLQFWNEGRTLRQQRLLDSGRSSVVSLPASAAQAEPGQIIHLVAELHADGQRQDPVFNQIADGLALRRRVEMYQWKERKESREETSVGGSKTTRTTYHYDQTWSDEVINHQRFEQPAGHENPSAMPFDSQVWRAERVELGQFLLDSAVVNEIGGWKPMAVEAGRVPENLLASLNVQASTLTSVQGQPKIGDVRIEFARIPEGELSVVGGFSNGRLGAHSSALGELLLVERGSLSAAQLFDAAERRNAGLGWALRVGGFVLMWVGFGMVFAPLAVVADVLPIAGRMTRGVTFVVSGLLAAAISFVAVASGWLYHRPWLLFLVVAALAALVVWGLRRGRARQEAAAPALSMPPPPPPPPPSGP